MPQPRSGNILISNQRIRNRKHPSGRLGAGRRGEWPFSSLLFVRRNLDNCSFSWSYLSAEVTHETLMKDPPLSAYSVELLLMGWWEASTLRKSFLLIWTRTSEKSLLYVRVLCRVNQVPLSSSSLLLGTNHTFTGIFGHLYLTVRYWRALWALAFERKNRRRRRKIEKAETTEKLILLLT